MNAFRLISIALIFTGLAANAPAPAEAATWETCHGSPIKWRGSVAVHRNRCGIPDSGHKNTAYWNGINQWDDLSGVITSFLMNDPSDCVVSFLDWENEVAVVSRDQIDGAHGRTVSYTGPCGIGPNDIDVADVLVASDLSFAPVWGNALGVDGRGTFVHEFGHFFGFEHESGHAVMRPHPPLIVTGGNEPDTTWPSDTIGMHAVYGFSISRPNLIPSALGVVGATVQTLDPATTVTMCRNSTRTTRVYLGNSGNVASGTYNLRIRLNTTSPFSGYTASTTVAASFTHSLGAFSQGTFDLTFKVPAALPNGTYFIYVDMDHTGSITELREGDNSTVSAMKVQVNC